MQNINTEDIAMVEDIGMANWLDEISEPGQRVGQFSDWDHMHTFSTMLARWNKRQGVERNLVASARYDDNNSIVILTITAFDYNDS